MRKTPKMVTIHETMFEALNEVKIAMDRIVNDALTDEIKESLEKGTMTTMDACLFGLKVLKIVKKYMGDEW